MYHHGTFLFCAQNVVFLVDFVLQKMYIELTDVLQIVVRKED